MKKKKRSFFFTFHFLKNLFNYFFRSLLWPFASMKMVIKGRFGKKRKQIFKYNFHHLYLPSFLQNIYYKKFMLVTKKGSYGFHIWIRMKTEKK